MSRTTSIADFGPHTPPPEYLPPAPFGMENVDRSAAEGWRYGEKPETHLTPAEENKEAQEVAPPPKKKGFLGWWTLNKNDRAKQADKKEKRKHVLLGPLYAGIGAGLSLCKFCPSLKSRRMAHLTHPPSHLDFVTAGISTLIEEWVLDGDATRFALVAVLPVIFCVSLVRMTLHSFQFPLS